MLIFSFIYVGLCILSFEFGAHMGSILNKIAKKYRCKEKSDLLMIGALYNELQRTK